MANGHSFFKNPQIACVERLLVVVFLNIHTNRANNKFEKVHAGALDNFYSSYAQAFNGCLSSVYYFTNHEQKSLKGHTMKMRHFTAMDSATQFHSNHGNAMQPLLEKWGEKNDFSFLSYILMR